MFEIKKLKNGTRILPLMATDAEFGPHLKTRIAPAIIGVGPVEAALNTTKILMTQLQMPDFVLLLGSSGSSRLAQGEIYQATRVGYRDMDASAIGFEKGKTPFLDLPAQLPLAPLFEALPHANLSTGADIVVGAAFDTIKEEMVDMESYAVQRACQSFDIPLIVVRGISDGKLELQKFSDWTDALPMLDKNLADAIDIIFEELGAKP